MCLTQADPLGLYDEVEPNNKSLVFLRAFYFLPLRIPIPMFSRAHVSFTYELLTAPFPQQH